MQSRMTLELPPKLILALGVARRLRRCLEKIKLLTTCCNSVLSNTFETSMIVRIRLLKRLLGARESS